MIPSIASHLPRDMETLLALIAAVRPTSGERTAGAYAVTGEEYLTFTSRGQTDAGESSPGYDSEAAAVIGFWCNIVGYLYRPGEIYWRETPTMERWACNCEGRDKFKVRARLLVSVAKPLPAGGTLHAVA